MDPGIRTGLKQPGDGTSGGQARVPVTYIFPGSGARLSLAGQHSDHPYALLAQAGVKTVVPATPADAYALLRTAIQDDDPVAVFAPAALLGMREELSESIEPVALGAGRIHRSGVDVTLVAVGHLVQIALAVARELAEQDISVEVFDPRSVHPFDWALLRSSVGKTGRLVIADDTNRTCGLAGEIIATIAEEMPLRSRPRRVTRADVAMPFAPVLERAVVPGKDAISAAVKTAMEEVVAA